MAAPPATSSAATNSSCARLSGAPTRHAAPAAVSFPSRPRPAALSTRPAPSRRLDVAAAGHRKLMGSLTSNEGLRFGVVVARFNEVVTNLLLQGALETFERYSVKAENITVVSVPGSFEVPITAQKLGKSGKFDAILCIGAVIRGDTTHYDAVANSAASGVLNAGLSAGIPCVFGVLTCEDMDQALNRAGGKAGNKGAEAALTAAPSNPTESDPCFPMGGSPICDGTLSLDAFNASATALVKRWKEIEVDDSLPDWTWKPCSKVGVSSEEEGYLALEGVYRSYGGTQEPIEEMEKLDVAETVGDDAWVESSSDIVHVYDFHVVYSFSYKVPILYFRGYHTSGQLLTLDEVKEGLPSDSLKVLSESKWTFITREEHPHLSKPWFTLHPCSTSDWMKLLLKETKVADKEQSLQYLPAWLSVVGQAVGLKIPLGLHCKS